MPRKMIALPIEANDGFHTCAVHHSTSHASTNRECTALALRRPTRPPRSTPVRMASRQRCGCVRWGARLRASAAANSSIGTASPYVSSLSVLSQIKGAVVGRPCRRRPLSKQLIKMGQSGASPASADQTKCCYQSGMQIRHPASHS